VPNDFAYVALILWPFISVLFYKHMPIVQATFWTIVGGFLFLPVKTAIDFPFVPPLNKESIPVIAALVGCKYIKKVKVTLIPRTGVERWLILVVIITPFFTMLNNQESFNGIPGLTLHDTISAVINQYLKVLPFVIGVQLINTYKDQILLFKLLVLACLIYSIPILFEVRMSPQLHTWMYGFFPHSWVQQYRADGFRPVVFMGHGLIVSMFVAVSLAAATITWKEKMRIYGVPAFVIVIYFFVLLILCKTLGAFILGTILLVFIGFERPSWTRWLSAFLIFIVVFYPLLSFFNLFPHDYLIQLAADFDKSRGGSLAFRFYHEEALLNHAIEKTFFGWGAWGRFRLEDSVTDGYWIITLGQYGIIGFGSFFGLSVLAVWRGLKANKISARNEQPRFFVSHILIVSIIMIDQLPNHSLYSWLWLYIGALLGVSNYILKENDSNKNRKTSSILGGN